MYPVSFVEHNRVLESPPNWDSESSGECGSLPCFTDGFQTISLWKLNWIERLQILWRGKLWLSVLSGSTQPPVWLTTERTPFVTDSKEQE